MRRNCSAVGAGHLNSYDATIGCKSSHKGCCAGQPHAAPLNWDIHPVLLNDNEAAFIVRVWLEQREIAGAPAAWRGSIEHVASGKVRYITNLDEIKHFIDPFLDRMGAVSDATL